MTETLIIEDAQTTEEVEPTDIIKDAGEAVGEEPASNFKCLTCGRVIGTASGMRNHIDRIHKSKVFIPGETHEATSEPPARVISKRIKRTYTRRVEPKKVPAATGRYVDVPVVFRIPIVTGEIQIVQ